MFNINMLWIDHGIGLIVLWFIENKFVELLVSDFISCFERKDEAFRQVKLDLTPKVVEKPITKLSNP